MQRRVQPKHNLVFSKRLYTDQLGEVPNDAVELHWLYTQAKGCVMRGKYAVTDAEALLLAALVMQIEYGDHSTETHHAEFLRNELVKLIPKHLFDLRTPEVWQAELVSSREKMRGLTEMMSKHAYIYSCMQLRGYGITFFIGKVSHAAVHCAFSY